MKKRILIAVSVVAAAAALLLLMAAVPASYTTYFYNVDVKTNLVVKGSPNLTTIAAVPNAAGYLKQDGAGVFSYDNPAGAGDVVATTPALTNNAPLLGDSSKNVKSVNPTTFATAIGTDALQAGLGQVYEKTNAILTSVGSGSLSGAVINTGASTATQYAKYSDITGTNVAPDTLTLASADFANQGTTTTVLHGNAAGNPAWGAVVEGDLSLSDLTTADASTAQHGFLPKLTGDTNDVLRGDGSFSTAVTTVSTNEWQNKTFKARGTGNVLGQTKDLQIGQAWRMLDGTGCTLANSNNAAAVHFMQPLFSGTGASNANYVRFAVQVPDDIDTTVDLTAKITVELGGADTADQTYHLGMVSVAAGSAAAGTAANFVAATITGDAGGASGDIEATATFTLTDWKSNVTAGQYWVIELRRAGAVDASTVASYLKLLTISYDSTQ